MIQLQKMLSRQRARALRESSNLLGKKVVFTNGCFDVLHEGHIEYLARSRMMGDLLLVALNTDESIRVLKGSERPFLPLPVRERILSALPFVDYIIPLDELTPEVLVATLRPDVLTKGRGWTVDTIAGREVVLRGGGQVLSINSSFPDRSSTALIDSKNWRGLSASVINSLASIDGELSESARDALELQDELIAEMEEDRRSSLPD